MVDQTVRIMVQFTTAMRPIRHHGSGKLHQLLEYPTCTPMPTVYPLQIRSVSVFVMIRV